MKTHTHTHTHTHTPAADTRALVRQLFDAVAARPERSASLCKIVSSFRDFFFTPAVALEFSGEHTLFVQSSLFSFPSFFRDFSW